MVLSINEMKFENSDVQNFVEAIEYLFGPVNHKNGCLRSDIFYNKNDITTIINYEEWESLELFKSYLKSDLFKQVLSLYELSLTKPEIKIFECDSVKKFAWIESIIINEPLKSIEIV